MFRALGHFAKALATDSPWRAGRVVLLALTTSVIAAAGAALLLPLLQAVGVHTGGKRLAAVFQVLGVSPRLEAALALFLLTMAFGAWIQRLAVVDSVRLAEEFLVRLQDLSISRYGAG